MAEPSPAPPGLCSFLFCFLSLRMKLRAQWHQYLFLLADSRFFFFNWKRSILGFHFGKFWVPFRMGGGYFPLNIYLLIWLHRMLVVAHVFFSNCAHGSIFSSACMILLTVLRQGSNLRPLHWKADPQPLGRQGSPRGALFVVKRPQTCPGATAGNKRLISLWLFDQVKGSSSQPQTIWFG